VDGHSFSALDRVFSELPLAQGKVSVVIADTVRGRGLPSIERQADRWFVNFTHAEVEALLAELHGEGRAHLTSETLVVR
jgi:transketolase